MFCHSLTACGSFFIVHSLALSKLSSYLRGSALQRRKFPTSHRYIYRRS